MSLLKRIVSFINRSILGKRIRGMEIYLERDGLQVFTITAEVINQSVKISEGQQYLSIDEALQHPSKTPINLCITGHGIVCKKFLTKALPALPDIVPGLNIDEVYINKYESGDHTWVEIAPRQLVDRHVHAITSLGGQVLSVQVGATSSVDNHQFQEHQPERLGPHVFQWQTNGSLRNYQLMPTNLQANGSSSFLGIEGEFAISILQCLRHYQFTWMERLKEKSRQSYYSDYIQMRLRIATVFTAGTTLFCLLIFNLWITQNLTAELNDVRPAIESARLATQEASAKAQINAKHAGIISQVSPPWVSFTEQAETIARVIPSGLKLTRMQLGIEKFSKKSNESVSFDKRQLAITGYGQDLNQVLLLTNNLASIDWVESAELSGTTHNNELDLHEFTILVSML